MLEDTVYWKGSRKNKSMLLRAFTPYQYYLHSGQLLPTILYIRSGKLFLDILYIQSGQFLPVISLLKGLNQVTVSLKNQRVYSKLPFLQINTYMIFIRHQVYLVTMISTIKS